MHWFNTCVCIRTAHAMTNNYCASRQLSTYQDPKNHCALCKHYKSRTARHDRVIALTFSFVMLTGCLNPPNRAHKTLNPHRWMKALVKYMYSLSTFALILLGPVYAINLRNDVRVVAITKTTKLDSVTNRTNTRTNWGGSCPPILCSHFECTYYINHHNGVSLRWEWWSLWQRASQLPDSTAYVY